jgi:hypothetical protein
MVDERLEEVKRLLARAMVALAAPTHEANDYNCEDWPIGEGCRGCDGDEQRELARAEIAEWLTQQ